LDEQELAQTVKTGDPKQRVEFVVSDDTPGLVGEVLSERYKILSELGSGGMGRVYKAEHLLLNKFQAVKVLHRHLTGESQNLERFKTEAKAASSLRHENLLAVTEYGVTDDNQPYIVMDYVEGESLAEMLKRQGKLTFAEFVHVFSQISKGLAHAHDQGVIHRDLKPSNIMISRTKDGALQARILDFGIAKILPNDEGTAQHLTQTGEIFGSPLYMSPEQCRGGKIDRRSDIYSLGCVMFEALTGQVPVKGPSTVETLYRHISLQAPTISYAHPELGVPADLEDIVAKALANDPDQRYQSATGLADDLGKANLEKKSSRSGPGGSPGGQEENASTGPVMRKLFGDSQSKDLNKFWVFLSTTLVLLTGLLFYELYEGQTHKGDQHHAKAQLQQAQADFDAADGKARDNDTSDAYAYATQALKTRQKYAPNSPALAASLDQVASLDAELATNASDPKLTQEMQQAEQYYLQAIQIAPNDKPYLLQVGKPKYMRDLASFYINQGKSDQAASLLEEVRKVLGKSVDQLSAVDAGERMLLKDFSELYWAQIKRVDAAKIDIRLSDPSVRNEELTVQQNPSFSGNWTMPSMPDDYSFELLLKKSGVRKLKAHVQGANPGATKVDSDDKATGSFDGPVGEISWNAYGGPATATIVRIGDYMVWKIGHVNVESEGTYSPYMAILKKQK